MKKTSKILIIASTKSEVSEFIKRLNVSKSDKKNVNSYKLYDLSVDILISGIGIPQVIYSLMKLLLKTRYDLVMNVGICGSFNEELMVGDSVSVILDEFADIGITYSDKSFKTLFEEEFLNSDTEPFENGKLYNSFQNNIDTGLPKVTGITVNTTSGSEEQIKFRKEKYNPDIETMEGAAVAYVCLSENINFLQIRTISNMVEPRNRDSWDIDLAIKKLADSVIEILLNMNIHQ